jgi:hypothetical protein
LLGLLILLAALGLHGRVATGLWATTAWDGHSKGHEVEAIGTLAVVALVLLLALGLRGRTAAADQLLATRLRTALRYVLGAGLLALTVALVLLEFNVHAAGPRSASSPAGLAPTRARLPGRLPPPSPSSGSHVHWADIVYAALAAILIAGIAVMALRAVRNGRTPLGPEPELAAQDHDDSLYEALEGGQRALRQLDDARAAIVACYQAMEDSLARAGTSRSTAETPDELLARASRSVLVSTGAASRLTSLFYEARFSSHPLDESHRRAAEVALTELSSQLGRTRATEARATEARATGARATGAGVAP